MKESEIIRRIRETFPSNQIGDDAAVLDMGSGFLYLSSDAVVEGVHFKRRFSTLKQVAEKLVSSNVSDINAMNGRALGFLVTAGLPRGLSADELTEILDGLKSAASFYSLKLLGGDTVLSPEGFFFDISIVGTPADPPLSDKGAFFRSGAKPGDGIVLFDKCGRSAAGLSLLEYIFDSRPVPWLSGQATGILDSKREFLIDTIRRLSITTSAGDLGIKLTQSSDVLISVLDCIKTHLVPEAKPIPDEFIKKKGDSVHAAIDISDGISTDLSKMCGESNVGAVIFEEQIPIPSRLALLADGRNDFLLKTVLSSGEEYAIMAAVDRDAIGYLPERASVIGEIRDIEYGLKLIKGNSKEKPLDLNGFEHTF